jgi:hypothetical protein
VLDVVVRDEFVDHAEVSRTDSLEELTGQGLVGIGHCSPSFTVAPGVFQ